jgi:hypothetical protein
MRVIPSLESISSMLAAGAPMVILASSASLETGAARALLARWAADPRNTFLLTSRAAAPQGSIPAQMLARGAPCSLTLDKHIAVPLAGAELRAWRESKEDAAVRAARVAASRRAKASRPREAVALLCSTRRDADAALGKDFVLCIHPSPHSLASIVVVVSGHARKSSCLHSVARGGGVVGAPAAGDEEVANDALDRIGR